MLGSGRSHHPHYRRPRRSTVESSWLGLVITLAVVGIAAVLLVMRSKRLREKEYLAWVDAYRATTAQPETDPNRLRELWMTELRTSSQARTVAAPAQSYPPVALAGDASAVRYPPPAAAPRTNTMALLSFIFCLLGGLLGIVFGHIALSQIKRTGESGKGLAIAGLVLGYGWIGLFLSFLVVAYTVSSLRGTL